MSEYYEDPSTSAQVQLSAFYHMALGYPGGPDNKIKSRRLLTIDHHEGYAIWGLSQKAIFTASITALVQFFRILTKIMVGTCTIIRRSSRHMTLISLVAHPPSIFKVNYFN